MYNKEHWDFQTKDLTVFQYGGLKNGTAQLQNTAEYFKNCRTNCKNGDSLCNIVAEFQNIFFYSKHYFGTFKQVSAYILGTRLPEWNPCQW